MTDTVITKPVDPPADSEAEDQGKAPRGQWRPLLVRMHFYAGILVAPFIFLACLTGAIYIFNPQIDRLMEPGLLVVEHPGTTTLPLNEQVAKAMAAKPGLNLVSVVPNARPDETTRVNLYRPGGPEMTNHTVFVNPYTGQVQGTKDVTTMGGAMPFSTWMARFHGDMGLGEFGRWYSEAASLWIVVLTLGGLVVWWQRSSVHRGVTSAKTWKKFAVVDRGKRPGVKRTMSWHSVIGVWTALFALLFGLSGLPFARETGPMWVAQFGNMHRSSVQLDTKLPASAAGSASGSTAGSSAGAASGHDMSGMSGDMSDHDMSGMGGSAAAPTGKPSAAAAPTGKPSAAPSTAPTAGTGTGMPGMGSGATTGSSGQGMSHGSGSGSGSGQGSSGSHGMVNTGIAPERAAATDFDAMVASAKATGVTQKIRITTPTRPGTGWTIAENKQNWPVAYDSALIDPTTFQAVRSFDWEAKTPTVDKMNRYIMLFHFGRLFGLVGQILFALTMALIMWIVWWGYKMWWQRRPRGTAWRAGKVPVRGAWRKAPRVSLVIWSVITLALFWFFPVLGVSALGFLVLDAVLGRIQAARSRSAAPAAS